MPKSSSASPTPSALRSRRRSTARSVSSMSTDSVISSVRRCGGSPDSASASRTSATMSECWICFSERLMLMRGGAPAAGDLETPGVTAALAQHPAADRDDQAGLLGDRDELGGRDQAPLGVAPAQQRLDAGDGPVGEPHDGLVVQLELRRWRSRAGGRCAVRAARGRPRASPARTAGSRPCRRAWRCTSRRRRRG